MTTPARKLILIVVTFALALAACAPAATPEPTPAPTPPPAPTAAPTQPPQPTMPPTAEPTAAPAGLTCAGGIKVGLIGDYTGPLAIYGVMQLRSFMLGLEYAAGAPGSIGKVYKLEDGANTFKVEDCEITVIARDDKGDPAVTATVARELIDVEKVAVLIGSVSSPTTATLQGLAKDNQKVLIVAPAAANDITGANFNRYTFRVSRNNYQDFINLCAYLTTRYKKFVQIAPDTNFGRGGAQSARDACTKFGGKFVADDIFAPIETTEFTPYMEQILASGAEAWIVTWAGGGFVPMFKAAQEVGVTEQMALGASLANNATIPVFYSTLVGQNSGILYHYTLPKNKINDWLIAELKARYNTVPDLFDADGMNAALALVAGLRLSGGEAGAEALIKALEGLEFEGPKGAIRIRPEDHVAIQDMYIVKILNVNDPEAKFFELVETTRPEPPCLLSEAEKARCGSLPYGNLSGTP